MDEIGDGGVMENMVEIDLFNATFWPFFLFRFVVS